MVKGKAKNTIQIFEGTNSLLFRYPFKPAFPFKLYSEDYGQGDNLPTKVPNVDVPLLEVVLDGMTKSHHNDKGCKWYEE